MGEKKEYQTEVLDSKLEQAYIGAEYENLVDYYIAIGCGERVEDPRPRMSFITPELEARARENASCVVDVIKEFDGEIEEGCQQ